jgi:cobalamin synthase
VDNAGMNGAFAHLVLNHFPPILLIVALFALVCRARRVAYVLVLVAAVTGVATFFTGRHAAQYVKTMDGVNREAIEPHQQAAGVALLTIALAAIAAVAALMRPRSPVATYVATFLLIIATFSSVYAALLGGRIHHPEVEMKAPLR